MNTHQFIDLTELDQDELLKLETDIRSLHEIFADLNNLVLLQGEELEILENNMYDTKTSVVKADQEILIAEQYQSSTNYLGYVILTVVTGIAGLAFTISRVIHTH